MRSVVDLLEGRGSRLAGAPAQGWLAVVLVAAMCLSLAWSLDDAILVMGDGEATDFLFWTALGGVAIGALGPTVGWGRWTTHLIGACFAALLTPLLVGWVLIPDGASPGLLFVRTTETVVIAWIDLVVNRELSTFQFGHHLLVLGLIVWASSQFATYAAFGHRRPLNAVVAIGLLLVGNMLLTTRPQMPYLVIYSVAALFLLVRFHTFDEQSDWVRRRIGDPSAISGLYLRGGSIFIVMAVVGSLLLTNFAASAPLRGAWADMGGRVLEIARALEPFLPSSGSGRSIGPSFGPNARITGAWITNDDPFLTIEISPDEKEIPYLATVVYHEFDKTGWRRSEPGALQRGPGEEILGNTADQVTLDGRRALVMTITPQSPRSEVFTPTMPFSVNQATGVMVIGDGGHFEGVRREASDAPYTVTALVPATEAQGGPTESALRAAGVDYPAEILALYGPDTVAADTLGEASLALLSEIRTSAGVRATPYDLAATINKLLRDSGRFIYDSDVRDHDCSGISTVECFAQIQRGYCEYYASTMAVLLREMGVPTRYVQGFLPGDGKPGSGRSVVRNSDSHAWVQVFFPGHGWVDFDPTATVARLPPLPSGRPVASASPGPSRSGGFVRPQETLPRDQPGGGGFVGGPRNPGAAGPLIAVTILLAVTIAAIGAVAWRRGPRGPVSADGTYGAVTRLASRLGYAPRPNQTVYEYAGALGDMVPTVRPELHTVANAKVEVAYGARVLTDDRMRSLREAHRRLRIGLLRLFVRRLRRSRKR